MKYSMCSTWAKNRPVEDVLDIAQRLGLDGVELWDGHIDGFLAKGKTPEQLLECLAARGLACVVVAPYLNLIDETLRQENLALAGKCIGYAAALRCPMVRVFLGGKASNEMTQAQWKCAVAALRLLVCEAEKAGITLVLEVHNDQPTDTKESILRLLRIVDSPALRLIFDGFNFYPTGLEMMDAYEPLKKYAVHYHFKNLLWAPHRCVPLEEGDADFVPLIRALRRDGYDGYISFEYFADDPSEMIRRSKEWFCKVYEEDRGKTHRINA